MSWESLEQLVEDLGLEVTPVTPAAVKDEVRKRLAEAHPDKTGGQFPSEEVGVRYHRLREALEFLENRLPQPIFPQGIDRRLQQIERQLELVLATHESGSSSSSRRQNLEQIRNEATGRYASRKIGSAVFAGICGAIISFSSLLKDNPVFGIVAQNWILLILLWGLFLFSGVLFILLWWKEQRTAGRLEWLVSDYGLSALLRSHVVYKAASDEGSDEERLISKTGLVRQVLDLGRPWASSRFHRWLKRLLQPQISTPVAEEIASHHLNELLRRGVIRRKGIRGIEPVYIIDSRSAQDLKNGHYYFDYEGYW